MSVNRNEFTVNSLYISPAERIEHQDLVLHYEPTPIHDELTIHSKTSYNEIAKAFGVGKSGKDPSKICDIYHNPKKHTTVVVFEHFSWWGDHKERKVKVKLDAKDPDNIYMAVASAVVIYKYGTNSQFKAHISRSVDKDIYGDALDAVYMIAAQLEVSEIFGTWDKFKELVDDKIKISE